MTAVRPERREAQQEPEETPSPGGPRVDATMRLRAVSASPGASPDGPAAGPDDTMQLRTVSIPEARPAAEPEPEVKPGAGPEAGAGDEPPAGPDDTMQLRTVSIPETRPTARPEAGDEPPAGPDDTMQLRTVSIPEVKPGAGPEAGAGDEPPAGPDDTMQLRTVSIPETRPTARPEAGDEPPAGPDDTMQLRVPFIPPAAPAEVPLGGRAERRRADREQARGRGRRSAAAAAGQPATGRHGRRAAPGGARGREPVSVKLVRATGELCVTLGVLLLLFVSYQLWWTNVRAHAAASGTANRLEQQWDKGNSGGSRDPDDPRDPGVFAPGQGFAIIWIPKLDVKAPIAEGTDKHSVLDKGMVGHYSGALETAMPWDKTGNFALAAHRNTHGEPFRYINKLAVGDKVVVETAQAYYTYAITSALPQTPPSNVSVIQPVPVGSGFTRSGRYITLTTCTPEFKSTYRLILWGKMVEERPRSKGKPDALLGS
ncbi:class E sortase [Peterkaempfera sp. SMS 1(5)a]|uniref:class E sortase n=1 Tax=Peterkaempfera podocarpi TaxID=3232308 RepID=UPI00366E95B4